MKPEILLFHAYWDKSSLNLRQMFKEVSSEENFKDLTFTDVDVETEEGVDLSCNYQVRNVPTILIVKKNRVIERISGIISKEQLKRLLRNGSKD